MPGTTTETYAGIFAPARTPEVVIDKLHAAINRITATTKFQNWMHTIGLEVAPAVGPEAFADLMKKSQKEWVAIKKAIPIE